MNKKWLFVVITILVTLIPAQVFAAKSDSLAIPTFTITGVEKGITVTIKAQNFPVSEKFTVKMGAYGTMGIGGVVVGTQESGNGSFTATYDIPASLKASTRIAIRLQSTASGYYSYNWFWNSDYPDGSSSGGSTDSPGSPPAGANTIPSTKIKSVIASQEVTVIGSNFTTNDTYTVYIGKYGTKGVGGIKIGTQKTNSSGSFTETYKIPDSLKTEKILAIRWQSPVTGYYAYDWFYNKTDGSSSSGGVYPPAGQNTIPTFKITDVTKNQTVTINATNFTVNDTYTVYMGAAGTMGIGGKIVGKQDTGADGKFTATYDIPASLQGATIIAIRLQSPTSGYYSYNWFYNSDYP